MRKITQLASKAFNSGEPFSLDNTLVKVSDSGVTISLLLHGNLIAVHDGDSLKITASGWNTPTTKERLNGLNGVTVNIKKGQLYLNGKGGEWVDVKEWDEV